MIKHLGWVVLALGLGTWLPLVWWLSAKTPIQPYNGDVMSQKVPKVCEWVMIKYLGNPNSTPHNLTARQISLDSYMAMRREFDKCLSEARSNIH